MRRAMDISPPDWSRFIEAARRHRVEQQFLAGLKSAEIPIPSALGDLRMDARAAAHQSLLQMRETARLAALFEKAGVPLLVLKGVALAVQLRRDPAMRSSRDIDLLVSPDNMGKADEILREAGYRNSGPTVPEGMEDDYRRWSKETQYTHARHGMLVELHHRLSNNDDLLDLDFQSLWREHERIEIGGQSVAVMSRRWLALYLCMHGATHGWERLSWLMDFSGALPTADDVENALHSAAAAGLSAVMLQALLLAHDWLDLPVAQGHLLRAGASRRVRWLNAILARSYGPSTWYRSPERGTLAGFIRYSVWLRLYVGALKPGWRYVRNQLAREFITPADWDIFRLPRPLTWLYPIIRPVGWLLRRLMRTV